jgi:hypothetical protein
MRLSFIYNQWLLFIFMINLPFWIMRAGQKIWPSRGSHIPMI